MNQTYLDRINAAPAISAPREITKDVIFGRLGAAMVEIHKLEDTIKQRELIIRRTSEQVEDNAAKIEALLLDNRKLAARINELEQDNDPEYALQMQDDLEQTQMDCITKDGRIAELEAQLRLKDQALFEAHAVRAKLQRRLEALANRPAIGHGSEHLRNGTGRIEMLRNLQRRFPGAYFKNGKFFTKNGSEIVPCAD